MSVTHERIPITSICIGERLAAGHDGVRLMDASAAPHRSAPIIVEPLGDGAYRLLAGYRELIVAWQRGAAAVPAFVKDVDGVEEGLIEAQLTALERAEHLWRRWAAFSARHATPSKAAFAAEEAAKAGLAPQVIEDYLWVAERLAPEVCDLLRPTPLADRPRLLLDLASISDPDDQRQTAEMLAGPPAHVRPPRRSHRNGYSQPTPLAD